MLINTSILIIHCLLAIFRGVFTGLRSLFIDVITPLFALCSTMDMQRRIRQHWEEEGVVKVMGRFVRYQIYLHDKQSLTKAQEMVADLLKQARRQEQKRAFGLTYSHS